MNYTIIFFIVAALYILVATIVTLTSNYKDTSRKESGDVKGSWYYPTDWNRCILAGLLWPVLLWKESKKFIQG